MLKNKKGYYCGKLVIDLQANRSLTNPIFFLNDTIQCQYHRRELTKPIVSQHVSEKQSRIHTAPIISASKQEATGELSETKSCLLRRHSWCQSTLTGFSFRGTW